MTRAATASGADGNGVERRRAAAARLIRKPPGEGLLSRMRRPLGAAMAALQPRADAVNAEWLKTLRALDAERDEFQAIARLDLMGHYARLASGDSGAEREALRREGEALALRGVRQELVVSALALFGGACLGELPLAGRNGRGLALSLARLTGASQQFLLAGYERSRVGHRADEQERNRLSRDLHDEVGADLVVLRLYIEMIETELARGHTAEAEGKLREALALVGHAIDSVRRLTLDLGPALLEQIGFLPAVRAYVRQLAGRTGIRAEVVEATPDTNGSLSELPVSHQVGLYRALQGALSNVVKHARATTVRVAIGSFKQRVVVMVIEDDGVGFDAGPRLAAGGFGLRALRQRMQELGGRVYITSRPRRPGGPRSGTRIEIDVPLPERMP